MFKYLLCLSLVLINFGSFASVRVDPDITNEKPAVTVMVPKQEEMTDVRNTLHNKEREARNYSCCTAEYCSYYYPTFGSFFCPSEEVLRLSANDSFAARLRPFYLCYPPSWFCFCTCFCTRYNQTLFW